MKVQAKKRLRAVLIGFVALIALLFTMLLSPVFAVAGLARAEGEPTGGKQQDGKFKSDYESFEDTIEAGKNLNLQIASEGFILLKNKNNALPLATTEKKVTVLGAQADSLAYGGGGSGGQGTPGKNSKVAGEKTDIFDGLEAAGLTANPAMIEKYKTVNPIAMKREPSSFSTNYRDGGHYMDKAEDGTVEFAGAKYKDAENGSLKGVSLEGYKDAAIVVISRSGAEGADNPSHNVDGHTDVNEHYLELDDAEKELMAYAKKNFQKIVVIINSPSVMELGCLEKDDAVGAILWIGQPGWNGTMAIGKILTGDINPSGRTVDFYMADFTTDPVWYNSTDSQQALYAITGEYTNPDLGVTVAPHSIKMGRTDDSETANDQEMIDYAEGIYMGYRYYETVAAEIGGTAGETWYQNNVVYPYGHGLSYTTFTQEITGITGDLTNKDGKIEVSVKVTNTGAKAGKEVVQLYSTPPYTKGGIEKAEVNLVGFTKTGTIEPNGEETVKIEIAVKDLASFDYNDKNKNQNCGYELETGKYVLSIRKNSHTLANADETKSTKELNCATLLTWDEDGDASTPNAIYSQPIDSKWGQYNTQSNAWTVSKTDHYLSRANIVKDGKPSDLKELAWMLVNDGEENVFVDGAFAVLDRRDENSVARDYDDAKTVTKETNYENLWIKKDADIPAAWTQNDGTGEYTLDLYKDMKGVDLENDKWDTFLNQLTWTELVNFVSAGSFSNAAVNSVGKPLVTDNDGPGQLKGRGNPNKGNGWAWACAVVVASTWNTELAYQQGRITGNESMWIGVNGWYGPGLGTHRSPLAGRNFEYYSQDGVQGGLIAAAVIKGATDMGMHVYMKHAFLNDQETNRLNMATFVTEQAIREIYAKTFELVAKKGNANGTMASFNLIGIESSLGYATAIQLYENEWGMKGFSVTDMWGGPTSYARDSGWTGYSMVRSYTIPLGNNNGGYKPEGVWDKTARTNKGMVKVGEAESPTQWYWTRKTAQRIFYNVVNGNGMKNGVVFEADTIKTATLGAAVGKAFTAYTAVDTDKAKKALGDGNYNITADGLPEGLSIDNTTGVISGTVANTAKKGSYSVTVTVESATEGEKWVNTTANLTIAVGPIFTFEGSFEGFKAAHAIKNVTVKATDLAGLGIISEGNDANYLPDGKVEEANLGKYIGTPSYSATGLPKGMTVNAETGALSGTPSQSGKFNVVYTVTLKQVTQGWWGLQTSNVNFIEVVEITVEDNALVGGYANNRNQLVLIYADGAEVVLGSIKGEDGKPGADGQPGANGVGIASVAKQGSEGLVDTYRITFTDGSTFDFMVVNGKDGADGADGKDGANGANGADGSGCGGVIGATSAVVAAIAILGGAAFVLRKKKED